MGGSGKLLAAAAAAATAGASIWHKKKKEVSGSPRLPKKIVPKAYKLKLVPSLSQFVFDGEVEITVDVVEGVRNVVLNAVDLSIAGGVQFTPASGGEPITVAKVRSDTKDELLILTFPKALPVGQGTLSINFQGTLNDQMKGFYRSVYTAEGEQRVMAVTQFEPADARRCFPCWDEPAFKATFAVTVVVPEDRIALGNMPVASESVSGDLRTVTFQESPVMSTYLVALVVGQFDFIEATTPEGVKVRVYTEVGKTSQGKFALDCAVRTLPFFAKYFGTPYPLPKIDMVAVPDFAAGAMENYGLVTYRATALLVDEANSAAVNKQNVSVTVTHELAHQWFGNLVTMEWWTHLWLNEGFASWVSYLAADHLFPDWDMWTQFSSDETSSALRLDGLKESHPIEVDVRHVSEIDEIFDAISYEKGGSVIRMLQAYLGPEAFQAGLKHYIQQYAYSNASTGELWAALETVTGEPVTAMMDTWTKQMGYPVISAEETADGKAIKVSQARYLSSGEAGPGHWVVPIRLCAGSYDRTTSHLLRKKRAEIPLPDNAPPGEFVKLNVGQAGFYRVRYSAGLAARLVPAVQSGVLGPVDRLGVLDDSYALSRAGMQPLSVLLTLIGAYRGETDFSVMCTLSDVCHVVSRTLYDVSPEHHAKFLKFACGLFAGAGQRLGWEPSQGEGHVAAMQRAVVQGALVSFGHEPTIAEALRRFRKFADGDATAIPADMRRAAYRAAMGKCTSADPSSYDALIRIFEQSDLMEEKGRVLGCLAASRDPAIVRKALDFSVSSSVRSQDSMRVIGGVGIEGRGEAWKWFKEKWGYLSDAYGGGFLITRFVEAATSQFASAEAAREIQAYFSARPDAGIPRTIQQCAERVRASARWVEEIRRDPAVVPTMERLVAAA